MDLADIVNIASFEPLAERALAPDVWAYVSGGAGDEHTLAANTAAWSELLLSPKNLVDVSTIDASVTLFGHRQRHPIFLAPAATHGNYTERGEVETLRGAKAADALWTLSTLGSTSIEECGAEADRLEQPWWMQVYLQQDRGFSEAFALRAREHGASALVLTIDTPSLGARDRDRRNNLGAAAGASYPNLREMTIMPDDTPAHRRLYNPHLASDATWSDLEWLVDLVDIPVLVKGVLRPDQAQMAIDHGAAGIIVSNHGARNLDTVPASAVALPKVSDVVNGQVPLLVDGGIRRGTDVAKAIALGADAVLIGRPYIWGLATHGAAGVAHVVEILETELLMAMALLGVPALSGLTRDAIWS